MNNILYFVSCLCVLLCVFKFIFRVLENKIRYSVFVLCGVMLLMPTSCSHLDESLYSEAFADGEVEFAFNVAESRANISEDGTGTFTEGDKIGLYIVQSGKPRYMVLTLENGTWMPKLKKRDLGSGSVTFSACFPAVEENMAEPESGIHKHSVATVQSDGGYEKSDLLWANRSVSINELKGNVVSLNFSHAMHRLQISLTKEDGNVPDDLKVEVRTRTEGYVTLSLGVPKVYESDYKWITPPMRKKQ